MKAYVESKFNRTSRNESLSTTAISGLNVFNVQGYALGKGTPKILNGEMLKKAHRYLLFNCHKLKSCLELHRGMVAENHSRAQPHVECIHSEEFATWFANNVESLDFQEQGKDFKRFEIACQRSQRGCEDEAKLDIFFMSFFTGLFDEARMDNTISAEHTEQPRELTSEINDVLEQTTRELTNESNEAQSGQAKKTSKKKGRGPTMMLEIWGHDPAKGLIKVDFDYLGRAIGMNQKTLSGFMGTIARKSHYCPIDVESWHDMSDLRKTEMLNVINARLDITLASEDWILTHILHCWRNWKNDMKARKDVTVIDKQEWRKSWIIALAGHHLHKKNINWYVEEHQLVMWPDKPGRVRMFGQGVTPSDVWGQVPKRNTCRRIILEQRKELITLIDRVGELEERVLEQRMSRVSQAEFQSNSSSNSLIVNQSLQVGQYVYLKPFADPNQLVAKGRIESLDPCTEVGGLPIGINWCQVLVEVIIISDAPLIKGYNHYVTVQDAHGDLVAWPCAIVTSVEQRSYFP
ncbi:OLC1v1001085C1 [Oldenlandia corymbosa var. corymbosa]|uniref:OLC1v1001085C1 n=1 Tax=Oldenlandia corymbosa var. corymbosa TaxID=529605 RepID=A0AAV1D6U6_OLDCO|nr:OLC1v1001085C1 [Oldenlandia corymbosa var. corymbosa]